MFLKKEYYAEFIGEFVGTFMLMLFGIASTAHFHIAGAKGDWFQLCAGWGLAVFFGILVSIKFSGAHLNLAVSVTLATLRRFDYKKIPMYFLAQLLGAMVGTAVAQALFWASVRDGVIPKFVWETRKSEDIGLTQAFFNEFVLTGMLILVVIIVADEYLCGAVTTLKMCTVVGLTVFSIGLSFGTNTGFALNPSRDLGARLISLMTNGGEAFTNENYYFWVPIISPVLGGSIISNVFVRLIRPFVINPVISVEDGVDEKVET